jgi:hypothetical protein
MRQQALTKIIGLSLVVMSMAINPVWSQDTGELQTFYTTLGGEIIFSWADASVNGEKANTIVRFSPVFNLQSQLHWDKSEKLGFFSGLTVRNVGFIFDDPTQVNVRYKMRSYTLGIPFAIKFGDMDDRFFFAGYELEFPFSYKEKKFVNEDKEDKSTDWFSKRTPAIYQSVFAGVQAPYGIQLKFKYYLSNFVDTDYVANDGNGNAIYPYQNFDANVWYISLSWQFLRNAEFIKKE